MAAPITLAQGGSLAVQRTQPSGRLGLTLPPGGGSETLEMTPDQLAALGLAVAGILLSPMNGVGAAGVGGGLTIEPNAGLLSYHLELTANGATLEAELTPTELGQLLAACFVPHV
jgi:hypothetical protein